MKILDKKLKNKIAAAVPDEKCWKTIADENARVVKNFKILCSIEESWQNSYINEFQEISKSMIDSKFISPDSTQSKKSTP